MINSYDEIDVPTNCYNCNNDCPGIFLDVIKHQELNNPETYFNMQFLIGEKLSDKGYGAVTLERVPLNGEFIFALKLEHTVVNRFVTNMEKLGYPCNVLPVLPGHKRRYRLVTFEDHTPMELLNVYHHLEVIA